MQDVKKDRHKYIGGSDIPIIMSLSPFKSRYDLLLEKSQLKTDDFEGNEYTEYGNTMEPKIRDYINTLYSTEYKEDKTIIDDMRYHADGYNGETVLEIKTTSQIHDDVDGYKIYLVQLLFGMVLHDTNDGLLAVYERPDDFSESFDPDRLQIFSIRKENYENLIDRIFLAVDCFRCDLEKLKENPLLTEEELTPTDITTIADKVVEFERQLQAYKTIEAQQKEMKAQLLKAMQDYGIKKWTTNGGIKITCVDGTEDKTETVFDEKRFKEEYPETYSKYLCEKTKKGRAAYIKITLPKVS